MIPFLQIPAPHYFLCRSKAFAQRFHYWFKKKRKWTLFFFFFQVEIFLEDSLQVFTEPSLCAQDYSRTFNDRRKTISHHYFQSTYSPTEQLPVRKRVNALNNVAQNIALAGINQKKKLVGWSRWGRFHGIGGI